MKEANYFYMPGVCVCVCVRACVRACVRVCVCSQNSFFPPVLCVASVHFSVCPVAGWAEVSEQRSPWSLTYVCGLTGCCFREALSTWRPVSMLAPAASSTTSVSRSVPQSQILLSLWDRSVPQSQILLSFVRPVRDRLWHTICKLGFVLEDIYVRPVTLCRFIYIYFLYQLRTILRLQGPWKWNLQVVLLTSFIRRVVLHVRWHKMAA